MTTADERRIIYTMFLELKRLRKLAEDGMDANADRPRYHGGIWDDDDYEKKSRQLASAYDGFKAHRDTYDAVWNFYKTQYSNWDVELAVQEGEGRIGELKYEPA